MKSYSSIILEQNITNDRKVAIIDRNGHRKTTWKQLKEMIYKVAAYATQKSLSGVVAVYMERSVEAVAAILGLNYAGIGVAPLSASTPSERCQIIANETKNALWTKADFDDAVALNVKYTEPKEGVDPAFVIFTSGSTGVPKGVMIGNDVVLRTCKRTMKDTFMGYKPDDIVLQMSSLSFVALFLDLLSPLYAGAKVHILPEVARKDVKMIADYVNAHKITQMFLAPKLVRLLGEVPSLKVLLSGSERMTGMASKNYKLFNCYGMSEMSATVFSYLVESPCENTPIGKPDEDVECYLVDENGNLADEGEICVSGAIAMGYYNNPELTAKVFTKNPFSSRPGFETLLHSGDIAKRLPDGNYLFLNRKDFMLKINGQRVEPGETEAVFKQVTNLKEAAVIGFSEQNGRTYLCAYYESDTEIDINDIQKKLSQKLPSYMIPAYYQRLDKFPLNANGKLDRKALKAPDVSDEQAEYVHPIGEIETKLCKAFEQALHISRIGANDEFIRMGGDSITAMEVVRFAPSLPLSAHEVLAGKTPRGIAKLIDDKQKETEIVSDEQLEIAPVSESQMGIYLQCMTRPNSIMYNIPVRITFRRTADMTQEKVKKAVDSVIALHPALYSYIRADEEIVRMCRNPFPKGGICTTEERGDITSFDEEAYIQPFAMFQGPLCRAHAILTPSEVEIIFDCHHIVGDGTSHKIIIRQIINALEGKPLCKETVDAFSISKIEKAEHTEDVIKSSQDYFNNILAGNEIDSNIIYDHKPTETTDYSTKTKEIEMTLLDVKDYLRRNALTENSFFMGAFGYVLAKMTGQSDSLFAAAENGRKDRIFNSTVSMFVRTLPVLMHIDETKTADYLLREVQEQFFNSINNDSCTFGDLSRAHGITTDVMFVYQSELLSGFESEIGNVGVKILPINDGFTNIAMTVYKEGNKYRTVIGYRASCYEEKTIERLLDLYSRVVSAFTENAVLKDIKLTNSSDIAVLDKWNENELPYDTDETVVDAFRRTAKRLSDNVALVCKDRRYTFGEVEELSDKLAAHISSLGIGRNDVVAVMIPRCEYMFIASLGVLKAGAIYQPLDPSYPSERLNFMCKDADAKLLIADRDLLKQIPLLVNNVLYTDEIPTLEAKHPDCEEPKPDWGFCLLYTSGTTGIPKGCKILHKNVMALVQAYKVFCKADGNCVWAAYASYGFDAHMSELYPITLLGGELHIVTEDIRLDLPALKQYFEENGVTHTVMTTQIAHQFASEYPEVKHLRVILCGGEKLATVNPPKTYTLINGYGPTEATVLVSSFDVDNIYGNIPIGKALPNVKLYVVDSYGRRVPIGVPGELVAAGMQVADGYLNREEKTKEVFVPNTFEENIGNGYEHCYKTGDIVRYLDDGNLEIIGRRDMQVKIRGFRIELSEVEAVIREYPSVKNATVIAVDNAAGGKSINAYVVADGTVDIDKLNQFIRDRKPPYMVPAATMQIENIPLTPNFKVDKRKLPKIEGVKKAVKEVHVLNDLEKQLSTMLSEIIGNNDFTVSTDFVSAGLTSISSIRFAVQIYKKFGLHITSKEILDGGTILSVENRIVSSVLNKTTDKKTKVLAESYELTQSQLGVFIDSLNGSMDTYNVPVLVKIDKNMSTDKLKKAIKTAVKAHPSMLCYVDFDENGEGRIFPYLDMEFDVEEETVSSLAVEQTHFEFTRKPLFRFRILHCGEVIYLLAEIHHIIADGESLVILLSDIENAYNGEAIEVEEYTAYDLNDDEKKARSGNEYELAKAYAESVFKGVSTDYLPFADASGEAGFGEEERIVEFDREIVHKFCQKAGISENVFFNGVFAVTLARFTAHDDALFTTIHNGRGDPRTEKLVTMAVKTLPFYIDAKNETKTVEFLKSVDDRLKKLKKYDIYSFADAVRDYGVSADPMFIYQGNLLDRMPLGEKAELETTFAKSKMQLSFEVICRKDGYLLHSEFNCGRYTKKWIDGFALAYETCMKELLKKETLGEIDICSKEAFEEFNDFNDTDIEVKYRPAYRMFEECEERHPDKLAVIASNGTLTYRQLNNMANDLAERLCTLGISDNSVVEVLLDRTKEIFVAQIGILKAGNAFICLSLSYPDERISLITQDSSSKAIITTHEIAETKHYLLNSLDIPIIYVDDIDVNTTAKPLNLEVLPDKLAYVIYTSGSTGKPKGVCVLQKGLVNLSDANPKNRDTVAHSNNNTVSSAVTAFTFDASVMEGFVSLANDSTVCIASEDEIHNPDRFCELCLKNNVNSLFGTPSFLMNLTDYDGFGDVAKNIETVLAGGEEFTTILFDRLYKLNPSMKILNGYGPSEATITCSSKLLKPNEKITIGTPFANTKMYCVDSENRILPMGALGELTVVGDGVGGGYINRPEQTKKAFIRINGKPAFKTGDLALIRHDNDIEFHGRTDNQVKIRGLRVELGEIENAINSISGIKTSVVMVNGTGESRYLSAYYTAERTISADEIIAQISKNLAQYMVPRVFMQLDAMPITINGKIDKKALPSITAQKQHRFGSLPETDTEKLICEMFRKELNLECVFADDNFFEIGGNSLLASKIVMRLKSMDFNVEYQTIFDCQTPRALAEFLGDAASKKEEVFIPIDDGDPTDKSLRSALSENVKENAGKVTRTPLGDVLLTGAVGFLGIHVLYELLKTETGHIYCLVRKGSFKSPDHRLNSISFYYFGECLKEEYFNRITIIDADITGENLSDKLKNIKVSTIINCAASVKHFAADDSIEFINVHGVENLIMLAKEKDAKLIQISTTSVSGVHTKETQKRRLKMYENQLFVGDDMDNKYVISKYHAELCMLRAIQNGLRGKIIRVGNLMGRYTDGEFQINMKTNSFLNALKGFVIIGKSPISHCTDMLEFSPVDCTAKAIVTLAGTNDMFTVFHANNRYSLDEIMLMKAAGRCGLPVVPTDDDAYYEEYTRLLGDPTVNKYLAALVTNDIKGVHAIEADNEFTANILYRLGFAWPFMDDIYLEKVVTQLRNLGFFDKE